jgi:aminoglycoside phosphotransferase (APT) family kinase protein
MDNISFDAPFARGRTADVFAWQPGQVLKLFHNWFALTDVEFEQRIARAVHASGVSAPAVIGEIVQVHGRNGLIYERIHGRSMLEVAPSHPWQVFTLAKRFAALHTQMHEHVFNADIPTQRSKFDHRIRHNESLPASLRTALLDRLASLPDGEAICHGDFHPGNVLVTPQGDTVIDWIDASRGNPLADVARTSIIFLGATATRQIPNIFIKMFLNLFHAAYIREYFRLRPHGVDEYNRWLPIVAAARLAEGMPELEQWLMAKIEQELRGDHAK